MKWFKHDASAHLDAKLQKLRIKHGLEGYGLYFYCLELIAMNVDENNLTFELEHDSEIIAFNTGLHYERVQEIISDMVRLKLFENNNGQITCYKLAARLDQSMTSNPRMRKLIAEIKKNHDGVMMESCQGHDGVMQEEIRIDKKRIDKKRTDEIKERFDSFWKAYPNKQGKSKALDSWSKKIDSVELAESVIEHIKTRVISDQQWLKDNGQFIPLPTTFLNQSRWEDEYKSPPQVTPIQPNKKPMPKAGSEQ